MHAATSPLSTHFYSAALNYSDKTAFYMTSHLH